MDTQQFRDFATTAVDYIADYIQNIREYEVRSSVEPFYTKTLLPKEAPTLGETWKEVLEDVDRVIIPGLTHWQSPHFHGYYPIGSSWPSVVAEMLIAGLGCIGSNWAANPACTELEVMMMNWLGKMINLPKEFLNCFDGPGGGVIQGSASESTLIALLVAKQKKVKELKIKYPDLNDAEIKTKLVAYSSDQSNSSVEKASKLGAMSMRLLETDEDHRFRGETLLAAIRKDRENGLFPCYVVATLGTTATCAFDNLEELGPICKRENVWLHIDAAYAGTAFVCPEYQHLMRGVEYADTFNFNPHKWMLVNFDCSAIWFKDSRSLVEAFKPKTSTKSEECDFKISPEYRHWQLPTNRRLRALKIWFVIRIYGVKGIQEHVRRCIVLARRFEEYVKGDDRFQHCVTSMGLVCFKVRGGDAANQALTERIAKRKKLFLNAGQFKQETCIRFPICSRFSSEEDIDFAWEEIASQA